MAYVKNTWVDQKVQRPKTYNFTTNDDGSTTLIDAFGNVEELGTPVNADNMNHIEDGLTNVGIWTYSEDIEFNKDDAVIAVVDNKFVLYKSLKNKNKGFALTNEDYWEASNLGAGGSGVELGTVVCMPFGVDESENKYRYLNGQVLIQTQYPAFTAKVKKWQETRSSLFTTETNWQAEKTASVFGQCGKFVIDDGAGTIRLPLVININGLSDLNNCGLTKYQSLPNIAGHIQNVGVQYDNLSYSGVFKNSLDLGRPQNWAMYDPNVNWAKLVNVRFNANGSNDTYKDGAPVQQEAIQYPYTICVNTGVEEAERPINDYTVNNPYSYGMNQYCQGAMNNNSWLKSDGQWNSGTVYTGLYAWCLAQLTAGVEGFKASTDTYGDYDFVINTAEQTFRLPVSNGSQGSGSLYYYCGDTLQNVDLINIARMQETIPSQAAHAAMPSNRYINLTPGANGTSYIAPADGWIAFAKKLTATGQFVGLSNNTTGMSTMGCNASDGSGGNTSCFIPCKKGDEVVTWYSAGGDVLILKFIYAEGVQ
uniref:Uncharacterized protein n=1 Tax=Dulem virus 31 TaxID=3145749 RepID=A0AAU8ATB9_9VIRU